MKNNDRKKNTKQNIKTKKCKQWLLNILNTSTWNDPYYYVCMLMNYDRLYDYIQTKNHKFFHHFAYVQYKNVIDNLLFQFIECFKHKCDVISLLQFRVDIMIVCNDQFYADFENHGRMFNNNYNIFFRHLRDVSVASIRQHKDMLKHDAQNCELLINAWICRQNDTIEQLMAPWETALTVFHAS